MIRCFSALTQEVSRGLSLLNYKGRAGGERVCTGCFRRSLYALTFKGNSGTLFLYCVPVYVGENVVSYTVQENAWQQKLETRRTMQSLNLTRPWLPGIQNGNNDNS